MENDPPPTEIEMYERALRALFIFRNKKPSPKKADSGAEEAEDDKPDKDEPSLEKIYLQKRKPAGTLFVDAVRWLSERTRGTTLDVSSLTEFVAECVKTNNSFFTVPMDATEQERYISKFRKKRKGKKGSKEGAHTMLMNLMNLCLVHEREFALTHELSIFGQVTTPSPAPSACQP